MNSLFGFSLDYSFIFSLVISFLTTILFFKKLLPLFIYLKFLDRPISRSNHDTPISLGGGLLVIPIIIFVSYLFGYKWAGIHISVLVILFLISLIDDLKNVRAILRLMVHFFCITFYVHFYLMQKNILLLNIDNSFLIFVTYLFMIIGITWFINAFNFMDGIDGITAIEVIFLTSSLLVLNYFLDIKNNILYYSIIGATIGFLIFNWSPAKIFLGDTGSIPLGFMMVHLLADFASEGYWVVVLILPMYYLMDTTFTLLIRVWKGKKFWEAHSEHFYQKAIRNGQTHRRVCYKVILLSLGLFVFAFFSIIDKNNFIFLILSIIWCIFFLLNFSNKKNLISK